MSLSDCDAGASASVYMDASGVTHCRCVVCARCFRHTGNAHQGHFWSFCKKTGDMRGFHFCCPDMPCEYETTGDRVASKGQS